MQELEQLALRQREGPLQGRRAADPSLAAEGLFSPSGVESTVATVTAVDASAEASLERLGPVQAAVAAVKERVLSRDIASADDFADAWRRLPKP